MTHEKGKEEGAGESSTEVGASDSMALVMCDAPVDNGIPDLDSICDRYNKGEINISQLVCTIWNQALYIGEKGQALQTKKVVANDTIREIIEAAHMAGQANAGVDPGYSNAKAYCNNLFNT